VGHIVIGTPGRKVPFWRRLKGEVSIIEQLITKGKGITVVVLDTKAISEHRPTAKPPRLAEKSHRNVEAKGNLIPESEAPFLNSCMLMWDGTIEKEEAMRQLVGACCHKRMEHRELAWEALREREQQGGTFVGEDVAITHARIAGLQQPLVAIGISKGGIQDRESGRSIRIIFTLLSPADSPESHVTMLDVTSKMARDDQWCKEVLSARKSSDVMGAIHEWYERQRRPSEA
jgi:two-component system sensor histidine kinase KdpD